MPGRHSSVSSSLFPQILDRIGCKHLTSHLRAFCDVLVCEFSKSGGSAHVNKCIEAMKSLIWTHNVCTLDRLVLCMALRNNEGNDEAQVSEKNISFAVLIPNLQIPKFTRE